MRRSIALTFIMTAAVVVATLGTPSTAFAADTWEAHDRNCKTLEQEDVSIGVVCAEVQKRVTGAGDVNGYRARVTVSPEEGTWFQPDLHIWSSGNMPTEVCADGCPQITTDWESAWTAVNPSLASYTVRGQSNYGNFDVSASWSQWWELAEKCSTYAGAGEVCVQRYERSYRNVNQERGRIAVHPQKGKWIEPRTVRVGTVNDGVTSATSRDLCDPKCTRRSGNWSADVSRQLVGPGADFEGFAAASFALPSGTVKTLRASYS